MEKLTEVLISDNLNLKYESCVAILVALATNAY